MTNDIEVLILGKLISHQHLDNVEKESDRRNWIDMIYGEESDERYQRREIK